MLAALLFVLGVTALLWLITFPIRLAFRLVFGLVGLGFGLLGLVFRLVFGLGGGLLRLVLFPFVVVIAGLALMVAFVAAVAAMLVPLIPVALLLLIGWAIYRAASHRTAAPI